MENPETGENIMVEQKIWNETMANLTLMALGSSAPEILLNLIMTAQNPGESPSELGPSTIVGSASFNLLVISGVSIIAVDDKPKKIARPGVFFITSVFSLFAYVWLFLVLVSISPERVEMWEAVLTFVFFPVLLVISYGIDRYEVYQAEMQESEEEKAQNVVAERRSAYKAKLKDMTKKLGAKNVCLIAMD